MMKKKPRSVIRYYITAAAAVIMALTLPLDTIGGFAAFFAALCAVFAGASFIPVPEAEAIRAPSGDRTLDAAVREGLNAIDRMRAYNARIPGQTVSQRIDRLEALTRDIFAFLKQHPEQLRLVRTFLDYTLPTTLKLLKSYAEFFGTPDAGDSITDTLARIEGALDSIVHAFEDTLGKLLDDRALDIETDIDVLKGMLAREGLENPFDSKNYRGGSD